MSDSQVLSFVKREINSGTTRSQVVIKLMQRGVSMDQIRRVRSQYEEEIQKRDVRSTARVRGSDFNEDNVSETGSEYTDVVEAKVGTATEIEDEATDVQERVEDDVKTDAVASEEVFGKKIVITSMIDNLLEGAVGQAVQNMNIMFGLDEKAGLNLKASAF